MTERPGVRGKWLCPDLQPDKQFVANAGLEQYPIDVDITAIGVPALARILSALTV
jgi:hypothetical protein